MKTEVLQVTIKDAEEVKELLSAYKELFDSIENFYANEPSFPLLVDENSPEHVKRWHNAFNKSRSLIYPEKVDK